MRQPSALGTSLDGVAYPSVVDATYYKSSYSNGSGNCVSVAFHDGIVGVQDSKLSVSDRRVSTLVFSRAAMRGFLRELRDG